MGDSHAGVRYEVAVDRPGDGRKLSWPGARRPEDHSAPQTRPTPLAARRVQNFVSRDSQRVYGPLVRGPFGSGGQLGRSTGLGTAQVSARRVAGPG